MASDDSPSWKIQSEKTVPAAARSLDTAPEADILTLYVGNAGIYEFEFVPAKSNPNPLRVKIVKVPHDSLDAPASTSSAQWGVPAPREADDQPGSEPDSDHGLTYSQYMMLTRFPGYNWRTGRYKNQAAKDYARIRSGGLPLPGEVKDS